MGDDVLVRGDDGLAHPQRRGDERVRRFVAAHELDDDVDRVVGDEVRRRVGEQARRQATIRGLGHVADGDGRQLEGRSVGRTQLGGPFVEGARDLVPDRPGPEDRDAQRGAAHRWDRTGDGMARW